MPLPKSFRFQVKVKVEEKGIKVLIRLILEIRWEKLNLGLNTLSTHLARLDDLILATLSLWLSLPSRFAKWNSNPCLANGNQTTSHSSPACNCYHRPICNNFSFSSSQITVDYATFHKFPTSPTGMYIWSPSINLCYVCSRKRSPVAC